jgi:hypothetical protein
MNKAGILLAVLTLALGLGISAQALDKAEMWSTFDDAASQNGSSTIQITTGNETIDGVDYMVVTATGAVTKKYQYGFAGLIAQPDDAALDALKAAKGISLKMLGDGLSYRIRVETSDIADSDYFGYVVSTKKGKVVEAKIPYSKLSQEPWGAKKTFDLANVTKISLQTIGQPIKAFSFKIFDLKALQ